MPVNSALSEQDEQYEIPVEEALELARGHHMVGNFVLAERTYHDILRADPDNPTANHLLGAMYYQLGSIDKALHYMKISTDLEEGEKQYWSNYGSILSLDGQYEAAIDCFNKALSLQPEDIETLNRMSLTHWQKGFYEDGEKTARHILSLSPVNLEGFINLGISLAQQEKYKEAIDIWEQASQHHPEDTRIWSNWSNTLREMKRPQKALGLAEKALAIDPKNTDALNNMGCILRDQGKTEEAIDCFRQATNIKPKYYQAHYNMSLALYDLGQHEDAAIAARYAIDFKEDYTEAYNALSSALVEIGEFSQAHFAAQRAVQLNAETTESYLNLADVLYLSSHFDDGHAALKEALKRDPDNARAYAKLANIYERLDEPDDALVAIDKAIELAPHIPMFLARKAALLQVSNDVEQAIELANKALEIAPRLLPAFITKAESLIAINKMDEAEKTIRAAQKVNKDYPAVYFTLSNLKKFTDENDEDFQAMLALEEKVDSMGLSFASSLHYAIAKAYENMKSYDRAFEYYERASKERRQTLPYDSQRTPATFESFKRDFSPAFLKSTEGKGFSSDIPVFIVGMPRSGTTLTEQIISSHPDVFGAGELPDITRARKKIGTLTPDNAKEMGALYVELISNRTKGEVVKRITDKMPGNYLNIGLIASILPEAKIIHCRRNPLDTCLSNYKQNFMVGQFWSYDLEEMGAEYLRYLDLMEYWREVLPGRILDIDYEETVGDLEMQARKLIDFIGLEWNDACLEPHKQERTVLTASKTQVTQPVYKSSVERWRRYEKQLQPLVKILNPE